MTSPARRCGRVGWWVGVWAVAALWLGTWALATGRYGGPDEPAHVLRAAALADGQILGEDRTSLRGGFRIVSVPATLATGDPACYRHAPARPATCADAVPESGRTSVATAAGANPPWYYGAVGLPARLVGGLDSALAVRLWAVAVHALLIAAIASRLRHRSRGALLAVIATVSPAVWFLAGVVNPNAAEILLLLLAWCGVAALGSAADDVAIPALLWVSVPTAAAVSIRPLAAIPALSVVAVVALTHRGTRGWRPAQRVALVGPIVVAAVAGAAWNRVVGFAFDDPRTASKLQGWAVVRRAVARVPGTLRQMAGSWSWLEVSVPWPIQVAWWAAVAVGLARCWRRAGRDWRWAMVGWAVLVVVTPVVFEVVEAHRVGFIWQGRYSLPTVAGAAAFALVGSERSRASLSGPGGRTRWSTAGIGAVALAELWAFWWSLRRYVVGVDGSWMLRSGPHGVWVPPVPPFLLLGSHLTLLAGAIVWWTSAPAQTT